MHPDTIAAIGAFLTGVGAVLGAMRSLRRVRKAERDDCDKRVAEVRSVFRAGYREGLRVAPRDARPEEDDERWSHLP